MKKYSCQSYPKNKDAIYSSCFAKYPSTHDVFKFIRQSGITSVELSKQDVQELLDRLVYDGKVMKRPKTFGPIDSDEDYVDEPATKRIKVDQEDEEVLGTLEERDTIVESNGFVYIALRDQVLKAGFTDTPCGQCPNFGLCAEKGPVTPYNCVYFKSWLSEF